MVKLNGLVKDSKLGQIAGKVGNKANEIGKKVGDKANAIGDKLAKTGVGKGAIAAGKFVNGKITNASRFIGGKAAKFKARANKFSEKRKEFAEKHPKLMQRINGAKTLGKGALRRSMPLALGMMGAAMSYATGSSGAMEAIGVGSALNSGAEEYFSSTQDNVEETGEEAVQAMMENDEDVKEAKESVDKGTEAIAETSDQLSATNKTISQMSPEKRDLGKSYLAYYAESEELDRKKAKLDPKSDTYEQDLADIEKRQQGIAKAQQELREDPDFAGVAKIFDHKHDLEKQLDQQLDDQKVLEANLKAVKAEAAANIIKSYKQNGSDGKIEKAKTEILKILQKCQMEKKRKQANGDVSSNFELNSSEIESAERMQKTICDLLDRTVLAGGADFDTSKFISDNFGNDSAMGQNLYAAVAEYQFQKNAQKYNQARSYGESVGVDNEKYDDDVQRRVTGLNG